VDISTGRVVRNLSKKHFKFWYLLEGIFFCRVFVGFNRIKLYEEVAQINLDKRKSKDIPVTGRGGP
jgi:hypothetical protein